MEIDLLERKTERTDVASETRLGAMKYHETLSAKITNDYWIVLDRNLGGNWSFLLWGKTPLSGDLGTLTEDQAKQQVLSIARLHLERLGLSYALTDVTWRVAVRQMVA